jgi:hypothetical protein
MNTERIGVLLIRLFCLYLLIEAVLLCTNLPLYWEQYRSIPNSGAVSWSGHTFYLATIRVLVQACAGGWIYQHAFDIYQRLTGDVQNVQPNDAEDFIE